MRFGRGEARQDTRHDAIAVGPAETEYVALGEINLLRERLAQHPPGAKKVTTSYRVGRYRKSVRGVLHAQFLDACSRSQVRCHERAMCADAIESRRLDAVSPQGMPAPRAATRIRYHSSRVRCTE